MLVATRLGIVRRREGRREEERREKGEGRRVREAVSKRVMQ